MIRDSLCSKDYWDKWVAWADNAISDRLKQIEDPSGDPDYLPKYILGISQHNWEQIIRRYSRGDPIEGLAVYFGPMLDAWEDAERLGADVWTAEQIRIRRTWAINFDTYHYCFWLISLALLLDIPKEQWQRLVALVGNEGEDILLDRLIASRSPNRKIGTSLCFPKPYARLLAAIEAPADKQAKLLKEFVVHWYKELGQMPKHARVPQQIPHKTLGWYTFADYNLDGGAYFGQWCLEAAAAAKVFGLDDRLCLGHRHYPGDFLRPNGPTTHPVRPDVLPATDAVQEAPPPEKPVGWLARLLGRR
ncbi:PoNe immunity protein domain-containing protein [Limnohabitans sp.]|uniref:PoNi-like cognate immunity protein n=1 Tax=Limnohabitans sp. TaxID=1907725 RepID=UPI00286F22DE|nr:PoNe immunity protein domain-containing protein [Limnohabitans sp.]